MSDDEWSPAQYRGLAVSGLLFGSLVFYCFFDFVFLAVCREGAGTVAEVYKLPGRRSPDYWMMEFKYRDTAGNDRLGKLNLGANGGGAAPGEEIAIQYLPKWLLDAPDAARPKRPFSWGAMSILIVVSSALDFFAYRAIYPPGARIRSKRHR